MLSSDKVQSIFQSNKDNQIRQRTSFILLYKIRTSEPQVMLTASFTLTNKYKNYLPALHLSKNILNYNGKKHFKIA